MATPHGQQLGHESSFVSSHARWLIGAAVLAALIVAIVLVVVYSGGGGSGGRGY
jgi:hypothetical protein